MFSFKSPKREKRTIGRKWGIEQDRIALFVVNRVKLKTQNPIETMEFMEFRKWNNRSLAWITLVINGAAISLSGEDAFGGCYGHLRYYLEDMSVDETDAHLL